MIQRFNSYVIALFLVLIGTLSRAQECYDLKNETPINRDELVATSSKKLTKRKAEVVEAGEELMKKELLVKLSEKIIIDVKSGSTNFVQENGTSFTSLFTSETRINSNSRLGNLRFEFCFDKRHKTLFGRCRLDKLGLAESIAKDCVVRLVALNAELNGLSSSGNSVNMRPLVRKYEAICSDFQNALFLNHRISTDDWNEQVIEYNKTISTISNSDANQNLKAGIDQANDFMDKDDYEEAITLLKNLRKRHNQNEDIEYTLKICYDRYLTHIRSLNAKLIQQREYSKAIDLINTYCLVATCSNDAKEMRNQLRADYFDFTAGQLEKAMRDKEDVKVTTQYNILSSLSDISENRFATLAEQYRVYMINRSVEKARAEKDKRNYWEAYSLLRNTEINYGAVTNELKGLKESIFRKIAQLEIREEKKSRPHLNTFEFGTEALFNELSISNLSQYSVNYMNLGFSAGVYFKYNFGPDHYKKGYPIRSDLIGIRARYINVSEKVRFNDNEIPRESNPTGSLFEVGPDGVLTRIFHYNLSVMYNQDSKFTNPMGVSASFGLRLPIHRIAIGVDGRYTNNLHGIYAIDWSAYFHGNLHFNRKFTNSDKRKVRARLKDY